MTIIALAASGGTGRLLTTLLRNRGYQLRPVDPAMNGIAHVLDHADAIVLIPQRGDTERHAHAAARALVSAARRAAPRAHLLLVTSFTVGHGTAHPLGRINNARAGFCAAEYTVRTSGLPYTVVRPTWLTDDPPGAHAVTVTQDPGADGMLSRVDLATALLTAIEQPSARNTTFALFNEPGTAPTDWPRLFDHLQPEANAA